MSAIGFLILGIFMAMGIVYVGGILFMGLFMVYDYFVLDTGNY